LSLAIPIPNAQTDLSLLASSRLSALDHKIGPDSSSVQPTFCVTTESDLVRMTMPTVRTSLRPAAFMSYAHFDDEHDNGQLSKLRQRISGEVRMQTGHEFQIFQDRNDIEWGDNWEKRVDQALDAATLLLVVITPSFFGSSYCKTEIARFRAREQALNRSDLILPVYYVSAAVFDDPDKRRRHAQARLLASRQYADWRKIRFESLDSLATRKAIEQLALRIGASFP
jgi:hypothetical protein